jgi:hypothetical protein
MNPWKPVSVGKAAGIAAALAAIAGLRQSSPDHWVRILDDANLVFHEAGHPLFGLLGPTLGLYGGTLGQLVFPAATSIHFFRQGETASFGLCFAWLFENFLNIGRYMADARAQVLPLIGGGEHDWTTIFSRWGVLAYDVKIGDCVQGLGWLGILGCAVWLLVGASASRFRTFA